MTKSGALRSRELEAIKERKACAQICLDYAEKCYGGDTYTETAAGTARDLAKKILARGKK